ncbi:MFS transporter [Andreprevotia chitinilytica]|uniref:MFS transporter n=1 Tax=Andreprevotia chitinilytica TaxID=396808 RepID=UPI000556DD2A|nr:MFS transporter [Andreprevotia chitinilytica]
MNSSPAISPSHSLPAASPAPLLAKHPEMGVAQVWLFGLAAGLVTGLDFIASAMIGIAGAHIRGGVHAAPEEYLWAISGYAAAAIVANLVIGRAAHYTSYRKYTLAALLLYFLGALGCSQANDIWMLVGARIVQGLGGGGLFTASRVLIQLVTKPTERPRLFWGFGFGSFGLLAIAPWLSAQVVEWASWRSIFWLQALLTLPVFALVFVVYPRRVGADAAEPSRMGHLDWPAALALGIGSLLLMHVLQDFRYLQPGAESSLIPILLIGVGIVAFIAARLHNYPDPWLDARRLVSRRYLVGLGFYTIFYGISGFWNTLLPSYLQAGLGFNFLTTGELMLWGGLATLGALVAYNIWMPHLFRKRRVIGIGFLLLAVACASLSTSAMPGASTNLLLPAIVIQGLTPVLIMLQVATMTYLDFDNEDFAHAYQLKNIMRELGTAFGTGMSSLMLQSGVAQARTDLVSRFDHATLDTLATGGQFGQTLMQWSAEIDRQATLITADHLYVGLAVFSLVAGVVALVQRPLR